jgi:hypothetical protein
MNGIAAIIWSCCIACGHRPKVELSAGLFCFHNLILAPFSIVCTGTALAKRLEMH